MYIFTYKDYLKYVENEEKRNRIEKLAKESEEQLEKSKTKVDKKHDKMFKNILSKKEEAVKFINRKFNLNIKVEEVEVYDKEFINKGGRLLEADIIYKIKSKKIFFLIEHQTKKDYYMAYRILNYEIEIMRTYEAKKRGEKEAIVLATVIYTGEGKWNAKTKIRELQEDFYTEEREIQTLGNYIVEDINNYTKEELLKSKSLLYKAMYLEKSKGIEEFLESAKEVFKRITKEEREQMNEIVRITLSGNMENEEIEEIIKELNKGGDEYMLAVKERIDAEFKMHENIGRKEETINLAKKMYKEKINIETIVKITGLKKEEFI